MFLQIFIILSALRLSIANQPVIFNQDNEVIASEPVKATLPKHHKFIPAHYPYYEVITNQTESSSTKPDSLPADLIEIASKKLGIKNLNEIPSISELGELLGTTSREETIDTIRQLTDTESGIDLIKAFIESSDYTDSTSSKEQKANEADDTSAPSQSKSFLSETAQKDLEIIQKVFTTPKPELGFFNRVSSYLSIFDLFPENKEIPISPVNKEVQKLNHRHYESRHQRHPKLRPISITNNTPDSFPIPIMPSIIYPVPPPPTLRPHSMNKFRVNPIYPYAIKPITDNDLD